MATTTTTTQLPPIPIATDLKSAIVAVNALRQAVQILAGQLGALQATSKTS